MKWKTEEEEMFKDALNKYKHKTYTEIIKMLDSKRTKKSVVHKNCREWYIKRKIKSNHLGTYQGKGENNANWKGGKTKNRRGYVLLYKPEHPRASNRYIFEHIVVAEQKIGRSIKGNEVVHHINGIKGDNRPENLEVLDKSDHDCNRYPFKLKEKKGWIRGRKSNNCIYLKKKIRNIISKEFYYKINGDELIISLTKNGLVG